MIVAPLPRLSPTGAQPACPQSPERRPQLAERLVNVLASLEDKVGLWIDRYVQRQQLQTLSDDALSDLGLSRCDVEGEVRKAFWQP